MELKPLLDAAISGGAVAILAVIIFIMYRNDKKQDIDRWQEMVKNCMACKVSGDDISQEDIKTRMDMTRVLSKLVTLVEGMNDVKSVKKHLGGE